MFSIRYTAEALGDLRFSKKQEQVAILDAIDRQLAAEPHRETRNRKPLRANKLAEWELRIGSFRVFYDVDEQAGEVLIKAIGAKQHNALFIRGREFKL